MKDREMQGIFFIIVVIIYTDKLHAAALDSSFQLCKTGLHHCWCYHKGVVHGLLVFTVICLPLPSSPRIFPLAHSCLDLFINSDYRHRRLKKTEKQTFKTPWVNQRKKRDRPRPLRLQNRAVYFISTHQND